MKTSNALLMLQIFLACIFFGCSGARISAYEQKTPAFFPEQFFRGETKAWGVFYDWRERLSRRFVVRLQGAEENGVFKLKEYFTFDDGEKDFREWHLKRESDEKYSGTAADVIGAAVGVRSGNALHWSYRLNLKTSNGPTEVSFDDWMFLLDEAHLFNRASISKYGLQVGEVILFFEKSSVAAGHGAPAQ